MVAQPLIFAKRASELAEGSPEKTIADLGKHVCAAFLAGAEGLTEELGANQLTSNALVSGTMLALAQLVTRHLAAQGVGEEHAQRFVEAVTGSLQANIAMMRDIAAGRSVEAN